jgi:hypothetical protein
LGKSEFFNSNSTVAPFDLVVGSVDGFDATPHQVGDYRKKLMRGVGFCMHFRPFCVRRVFPNARLKFLLQSGIQFNDEHEKMRQLFEELQQKYYVNTLAL